MTPPPNYQSGAVLIVALVMLLLLTILGIGGIQTSSLQERMAGNMRDQNLAFQNAEMALRQGEAVIQAKSAEAWKKTDPDNDVKEAAQLDDGVQRGTYQLTYLPGVSIREAGEDMSNPAIGTAVFRVDAEGYGVTTTVENDKETAGSRVHIRSTYVRR